MSKLNTEHTKARYPLLDLLRYFAALLVALMHWGLELGPERMQSVYRIPVLGFLIQNGAFGVDIFFLISGFVIIETARRKDALDFLIARFVRLFPGLFVSMTIVLFVGTYFIGSYELSFSSYVNSVFLTYQAVGVQPLATQLWTLIYEVKFYGGIAILLLVANRAFKSSKGILSILVCWQAIVYLISNLRLDYSTEILNYASLGRLGNLFALGICINILSKIELNNMLRNLPAIAFSIYFCIKASDNSFYDLGTGLLMAFSAVTIFFSPKIEFGQSLTNVFKLAGLSSYLIYLLHLHLGMAFLMFFQAHFTRNMFVLITAGTLFITIFSTLVAWYLEKPIQEFLSRKVRILRRMTFDRKK